jgi:hypothetical protein
LEQADRPEHAVGVEGLDNLNRGWPASWDHSNPPLTRARPPRA